MGKKNSFVCLQNLTKRFGTVTAVENICLDISQGDFITLLGPSGSGKTTTLMMVAGFELPTEGEIYIDGEPMAYKPPYKRDIGMVFQNYALFPHMRVYDNIAFPLNNRKFPKTEIDHRVEGSLELVKLTGLGNRYPKQLSGGQQQRVALARALVFNPSVLLMDEPLGALDKKLREHMQLEIKRIQERIGITVIYVTHDQSEALTMSDKIVVMNNGKMEQTGTPNELYERPANQFVADFIGESNLLTGEVLDSVFGGYTVKAMGDAVFFVSADRPFTRGETIQLAVRPEKVFFIGSEHSAANSFEGVVKGIIYVGDNTKYEIQLPGLGQTLMLKQLNQVGTVHHSHGDRVRIGWNPEDGKLV